MTTKTERLCEVECCECGAKLNEQEIGETLKEGARIILTQAICEMQTLARLYKLKGHDSEARTAEEESQHLTGYRAGLAGTVKPWREPLDQMIQDMRNIAMTKMPPFHVVYAHAALRMENLLKEVDELDALEEANEMTPEDEDFPDESPEEKRFWKLYQAYEEGKDPEAIREWKEYQAEAAKEFLRQYQQHQLNISWNGGR
jgi:hypothetical protein